MWSAEYGGLVTMTSYGGIYTAGILNVDVSQHTQYRVLFDDPIKI